jgi:hypothetical protein
VIYFYSNESLDRWIERCTLVRKVNLLGLNIYTRSGRCRDAADASRKCTRIQPSGQA